MASSNPLLKAKQIKELNESKWMELEEVVAVGIGMIDDKPGIIISVKSAADSVRKKVPPKIDGVPIKVEKSGEIFAN